MRTVNLLFCGCLAISVVAAQVPARPDFSGEWVLDPAKTTMTGAPMRVGGPGAAGGATVTEPKKIKHVNPVYPPAAQRARISGMVLLEAIIDRRGNVSDLRLIRSIPELDRAAVDAVSQWKYTPTLVAGVPVEVMMTVTVTFSLDGASARTGAPVPSAPPAWPTQPPGAVRPGLGRGFVSPVIVISQDDKTLTMTRKFADATEEIRYRFDGKGAPNKLPGTGGAVDNTYTYVSRWDGDKLVTSITWTGPQGPRQRTETISVSGDTLTMQLTRLPDAPGAEPIVTTNVFSRKR
jgi:TonB family protein